MKAIIKKSITLLAAVSLALPFAPVPVAQAQGSQDPLLY